MEPNRTRARSTSQNPKGSRSRSSSQERSQSERDRILSLKIRFESGLLDLMRPSPFEAFLRAGGASAPAPIVLPESIVTLQAAIASSTATQESLTAGLAEIDALNSARSAQCLVALQAQQAALISAALEKAAAAAAANIVVPISAPDGAVVKEPQPKIRPKRKKNG